MAFKVREDSILGGREEGGGTAERFVKRCKLRVGATSWRLSGGATPWRLRG